MKRLETRNAVDTELPAATDPILPRDHVPSSSDPIPLFGDEWWPLRFYSANPSAPNNRIHWQKFPASLRESFRLAAWALFHVPVPHSFLAQAQPAMVSSLSAGGIYSTSVKWRMLATWMHTNSITALEELTETHLRAYAEQLLEVRKLQRATIASHLLAVSRLWLIGQQIRELAIGGVPPWLVEDAEEFLPGTQPAGENLTDPLATPTIAGLLTAAIDYITVSAESIAAARDENRRTLDWKAADVACVGREGTRTLNAYLERLRESGQPLPVKRWGPVHVPDSAYIARLNGVTRNAARNWTQRSDVREYASMNGSPTCVAMKEHELMSAQIPFTEVSAHVSMLQAACFVVIAYLTGMRPVEALALEAGSLRPSSRDGGWMLIESRTFKAVKDESGNHDSRGRMRAAPWVAVAPVILAIRALERLVGNGGLLFPTGKYIKSAGRARKLTSIGKNIIEFIDYVNARCPGRIPADPRGRVNPMRFRRTLAWHIANQPGGLVALAVQYGHLRTAISEGYASRVRDGIHDLVDFETARAIATRLSEMSDAADAGEGISGPAARRLVVALREQKQTYRGIVTDRRQSRALLSNPNLTVYEDEDGFLVCNFKQETAKCLSSAPEPDTSTPRFDKCKSNCTNIARTDRNAVQLRLSATRYREEASVMPRPAAERLRAHADGLEAIAAAHDDQRIVIGVSNDGR